jgi:hypothetical protein
MATDGHRMHNSPDPQASSLEKRRAILQRVLSSHQIEKSPRIRDFLAYVCDRSLEDPSAEIHEQRIGCRVFGRDADYDTAVDNVVRVTASQTRKKLEQYFSSEGSAEPIILEIPRGQYTPIFRERNLAVDTAKPPQPTTGQSPAPSRTVLTLAASSILLAIVAIWACVTLWTERKASHSELDASPALNALWSQLLRPGSRTEVVVVDSSLSLFQELLPHQLTLPEYLQPDIWMRGDSLSSNPKLQAFVQRTAQRRLTSLGSVTTAFRIAQFAGSTQARISVVTARDFNIRQMKSDNVVLLGSSIANPWISLVEDHLNFRFGFDRVSRFAYFENRKPRPGEPQVYRTDSDVSYCQIAFLPNLTRTGNILAICGAEVEGTEGGGEFVTSETSLVQLQSFGKVKTEERFPYFEVLLKSSKLEGSTSGFIPVAFRLVQP